MEDEDEIYYLDTRNAPYVVSRSQNGRAASYGPNGRAVAARSGNRLTNQRLTRYGSSYGNPYTIGTAGEYGALGGALGGGLFGGASTGGLVDMVAQIIAAVMPLPTPPTATADPATDVGNLMTYQTSLASYAKRDEQMRTVGNLLMKLLG